METLKQAFSTGVRVMSKNINKPPTDLVIVLWIIESMWSVDISDKAGLALVCCRCEWHSA